MGPFLICAWMLVLGASQPAPLRARLNHAVVRPQTMDIANEIFIACKSNRKQSKFGPFQQQRPVFLAAANNEKSIPNADLPEVAVIGRSNVGKSSLLNSLTGSTALARVSDKPGRTQQLVWFRIGKGTDSFNLVDMPGYGFALAAEERVAAWAQLSAHYLQNRPCLKLVLVLVDSRVGLKSTDLDMFAFLEHSTRVRYLPVLTKVDLGGTPLRIGQMATVVQETLQGTSRRQIRPLHLVSSRYGAGIETLQRRIFAAASGQPDDAFMTRARGRASAGGRGTAARGRARSGRGRNY